MKSCAQCLLVMVSLLFGSAALLAQSTGAMEGTVADPSDALLANVTVRLTNAATGVSLSTRSQESGSFRFEYLAPGTYTVNAESAGFKTALISGVVVEVGKTTSLRLRLAIGTAQEVMTVTADAVVVDTSDAQVSTNASTKYVRELPSEGRDALSFGDLAPGVTINSNAASGAAAGLTITGGTTANVNGNRDQRNNYYLDGSDNAGAYRNYSLAFPNPDTVAEVQVTSSNATPEYGRQMGGIFNVVTKSGTNQFHGDAYYYFRNKLLDANDPGFVRAGQARPDDFLKTWGATLGGPILKNKTFFFVSFQRYTNKNQQIQNSVQAPTPRMLTGDFSELLNPPASSGLNPVQLYNPNTQALIPNNRIDLYAPQLLNTVGMNLSKLLPTVANYGDYFTWAYSEPQWSDEVLGKLDHAFNNAQHVSVSLLRSWGRVTFPATDGEGSNAPNWGPQADTSTQTTFAAHDTWMLSPRLLLETSGGITSFPADRDTTQHSTDLADLGAQNFPVSQAGARKFLPSVQLGNNFYAFPGYLSQFAQHNYRLGSTLTWNRGVHQMKFGFQAQRDSLKQYNDAPHLNLNFFGGFSTLTQGTNNCCPGDIGSSTADLLMGLTTGFSETGIRNYDIHNWSYFFFGQDEWKVLPRLTITPGLRYEFYSPASESQNRLSGFIPGYQSTLYPNAPVGLAFAGDPGVPAGFYKTDYTDLAPRLGIAWDPKGDGNTAVRAGVGLYYSYNAMQIKMLAAEQNPWQPTAGCAETVLSDPWLDCQTPSFSAPPTPFNVTPQGLKSLDWSTLEPLSSIAGYAPNFKTPYSTQWNLSIQHKFRAGITAQSGYVGNRVGRLTQNIPINYAQFENDPITGLPPSLDPQNLLDREPYAPVYDVGLIQIADRARSIYDGWQSTVDVQTFHGLNLRAVYEYAHGKTNGVFGDPTDNSVLTDHPENPTGEWGDYLIHHTFKLFYVWDIPFSSGNNFAKKIAGGWRLSGALHAYSGTPTNVTLGYNWNYDGVVDTNGNPGDRPDHSGSVHYIKQNSPQGYVQWLDLGPTNGLSGKNPNTGLPIAQRGAFLLPGGGTNHNVWSNTPVNFVMSPGTWTTDMALMKDYHFTEQRYVEFRFEAYNLFNHAQLGGLDTSYTDSTFGQLLTISGHRASQVALKFYF